MAHTGRVTPENYLNLLEKEAKTMLNVFMNVVCRFGHGFNSLYHRHTTK